MNYKGGESLDYLLRGVPEDLWRKAKAKATLQGFNMKQLLIFLLEAWIGDQIGVVSKKKQGETGSHT
jgi:hypothetical protein